MFAAYVCGDRDGLHLEKPIEPGESLREGRYLDIDAELQLVREAKKELMDASDDEHKKTERKAMKELGIQRARHFGWSNTYVFTKAMGEMLLGQLRGDMPVVVMRPSVITSVREDPLPGWMQGMRTIDTLIIGYAKQNLSCFLGDLSVVVDVIPGDMVANAMMAALVAHSEEKAAEAVPRHLVAAQPSRLLRSVRVRPPALLSEPARGEGRQGHPHQGDALLPHNRAVPPLHVVHLQAATRGQISDTVLYSL
jgi:fatty acyl-CoA reductase